MSDSPDDARLRPPSLILFSLDLESRTVFAKSGRLCECVSMSNKELVIGLLSRLPEDTPLADIAREIELLAGIKVAREQASHREGVAAEDARKLVDAWAGQ
jgi:hypothetical protein